MSTTGYIVTAWVVTFGAVGGYAGVGDPTRPQAVARSSPPDRRRWM